jgi:hypothetical protein
VANIVVVFEEVNTKPALGDEADHVNVAPGVFVTLKLTEFPRQTGFGMAVRFCGTDGAPGSVKLIVCVETAD